MTSLTSVGLAPGSASLLLVALLLLARVAGAQQPAAVIAGVVRDSGGRPIPSVDVALLGHARSARTDSAGAFRIAAAHAGPVMLAFRHFGFEPETVATTIGGRPAGALSIVLHPFAQDLPAMRVTESELRAREALQGFYRRKERGGGFFITRAQIEKRRPLVLSDMLRTMPGAVLQPTAGSGRAVLRFARSAMPGHDCPPQYYVDGVMAIGLNIDDLAPEDIEGVEVYDGISQLPPQFNDASAGTSMCGVVVVWTRVPGT